MSQMAYPRSTDELNFRINDIYRSDLLEHAYLLSAQEEIDLATSYYRARDLRAELAYGHTVCLADIPEILQTIQDGLRAREILVERNLRLVLWVAGQSYRNNLIFDDLVQEGNIGLLYAIESWDPERGLRFGTYAVLWIRQRIQRYSSTTKSLFQIPVHVATKVRQILNYRQEHLEKYGYLPTHLQISDVTGFSLEMVTGALRSLQEASSLEVDDSEEGYSDEILAESDTRLTPEDRIDQLEDEVEAQKLLSFVSKDRDRAILELIFGFDEPHERSMAEVGRILGVKRERIRQIRNRAIMEIQKHVRDNPQEEQ
jgi:RNA polymerase sigma factor (sigma-70 family)